MVNGNLCEILCITNYPVTNRPVLLLGPENAYAGVNQFQEFLTLLRILESFFEGYIFLDLFYHVVQQLLLEGHGGELFILLGDFLRVEIFDLLELKPGGDGLPFNAFYGCFNGWLEGFEDLSNAFTPFRSDIGIVLGVQARDKHSLVGWEGFHRDRITSLLHLSCPYYWFVWHLQPPFKVIIKS